MKQIILFIISLLFINLQLSAYILEGTAVDAETGEGLPGIQLFLTGGTVQTATTGTDGTFIFPYTQNGAHVLEFHYYEPVVINGNYYLRTVYPDTLTINGSDTTGIVFEIPPHHPVYHVSGTLYNAATNQPITGQTISLRLDFFAHSGFFYAWSEIDGTYSFEDPVPDWTYLFNAFGNAYYYGDEMEFTIDTLSPQELTVDFSLQPKSGVTVSGQLFDVETNEPIAIANRTVRISAIYPYWAETDENGEFTFVNVDPGYYANITVTSEDTAYINCPASTITDFVVPDSGMSGVALYQQKFVTKHVVTVDDNTFTPGEVKTLRFSLVQDDLVYGAIWGVELHIPPNLQVMSTTDFTSYIYNDVVFEPKDQCTTPTRLVWEGYHSVFGSGNVGNLNALNDSVYADVEFAFSAAMQEEDAEIFYEVFYSYACVWQPFSYGTILLENTNASVGIGENRIAGPAISSFPNPVSDEVTISLTLNKSTEGRIVIFDNIGHVAVQPVVRFFKKGNNLIRISTNGLREGLYFYSFFSAKTTLTGKMVVAR